MANEQNRQMIYVSLRFDGTLIRTKCSRVQVGQLLDSGWRQQASAWADASQVDQAPELIMEGRRSPPSIFELTSKSSATMEHNFHISLATLTIHSHKTPVHL